MSRTLASVATFLVLLACSSLLLGQRISQNQEQTAGEAPDTSTCSFSYNSGSGDFFTRYCLSVNGNVVQLDSPSGIEYINVGSVAEGYGICDVTGGNVRYFDYANTDSGNWGPTSVSAPNATTRKFVRTTTSGIWTLTQTIKQIKANASGAGSTKITMALKNLTGIARDIFLVRHADVDAAGTLSDDEFNYGHQNAVGQDHLFLGLQLTNNSAVAHFGATWSVFSGPDPCLFNTNRNLGPFVGDGSIGHIWAFTVPAGATKSVAATYKPF